MNWSEFWQLVKPGIGLVLMILVVVVWLRVGIWEAWKKRKGGAANDAESRLK